MLPSYIIAILGICVHPLLILLLLLLILLNRSCCSSTLSCLTPTMLTCCRCCLP
jgi:hypothetical protein